MFTENNVNSDEIIENRFSANYKISPWPYKVREVSMILLLIALITTTFCSNITLHNNREPVVEFYSAPGLYSFKTASNILILQLDILDEGTIHNLKDVDYITFSEDRFILWVNEDSIIVSVLDDDEVQFTDEVQLSVDGIIHFANKDINLSDLASILQQMSDKSELNCWAGGAGAKSCTVRHGISEVKTICREGLNPCCTREILGICTPD